MKTEELKAQGLTDDQIAFVMAENGKDIQKWKNDNAQLTADKEKAIEERDNYKSQYEAAADTLKGFEGKDFDAITKERDEWKEKAAKTDADLKKRLEETEAKYTQQIEERDFNDALVKALSNEKFTSEFAKDGIVKMIKDKGLKREGDKILGLDDYVKELKESQKDAFAPADEPAKAPTYTTPTPKSDDKGGDKKVFSVPKVW